MPKYAQNTTVDAAKSRHEIERILTRYGATGFAYGWQDTRAMIQFDACGKRVRFELRMPDRNDDEFRFTPAHRHRRTPAAQYEAWEQACRQRWRALALCIKAKLEAVEAGISEFTEEFLSKIVLPNGQTAGEWMIPQIERAYASSKMPPMLPAPEKWSREVVQKSLDNDL